MHIAFVASECVPFSKTGGLADVVGALPRALAALGHQVSVYLPHYRHTKLTDPQTVVRSITGPVRRSYRFCSIVDWPAVSAGVRFYFVDYPPYFDREALYGTPAGDYPDNAERFALFSRAVLEASKILGVPDLFHCHDWQSALIPVLLRHNMRKIRLSATWVRYSPSTTWAIRACFPPEILPLLMLPWDLFTIAKMEFFGKVNFLKGALVYSDNITTVSRKYSQEIQTTEYGFGLEGVLRDRAATVTGILNGVDYDEWNPQTDKFIAAHYSAEDLSGKAKCKQDLLRQLRHCEADSEAAGDRHRLAVRRAKRLRPDRADHRSAGARRSMIHGRSGQRRQDLRRNVPAAEKQFPQQNRGQGRVRQRHWPTRSKRAPTCSSCLRATNLAA